MAAAYERARAAGLARSCPSAKPRAVRAGQPRRAPGAASTRAGSASDAAPRLTRAPPMRHTSSARCASAQRRHAGVAQPGRAPAFQAGCREFESRPPLQILIPARKAPSPSRLGAREPLPGRQVIAGWIGGTQSPASTCLLAKRHCPADNGGGEALLYADAISRTTHIGGSYRCLVAKANTH